MSHLHLIKELEKVLEALIGKEVIYEVNKVKYKGDFKGLYYDQCHYCLYCVLNTTSKVSVELVHYSKVKEVLEIVYRFTDENDEPLVFELLKK
jgi:uncharacterized protein YuzB (UPF0349 family)